MASLERRYVSTGHLPDTEMVQSQVEDAHRRFKSNGDGKNSQVDPPLARVPSECSVSVSSEPAGASTVPAINYEFSIMSASKPFVFARSARRSAPSKRARNSVRTGLPFNSLAAIEDGGGRTNPMAGKRQIRSWQEEGESHGRNRSSYRTANPCRWRGRRGLWSELAAAQCRGDTARGPEGSCDEAGRSATGRSRRCHPPAPAAAAGSSSSPPPASA